MLCAAMDSFCAVHYCLMYWNVLQAPARFSPAARTRTRILHVELDLLLLCNAVVSMWSISYKASKSVNTIYLYFPLSTIYISGGKGDILVRVCWTFSQNIEKCKKLKFPSGISCSQNCIKQLRFLCCSSFSSAICSAICSLLRPAAAGTAF